MGKKRRKRKGRPPLRRRIPPKPRPEKRPLPIEAIHMKREQFRRDLASRSDTFSQLLAKAMGSEKLSHELIHERQISAKEHERIREEGAKQHTAFRQAFDESFARIREVMRASHPLGVLARVMSLNIFSGWGTYFEPTAKGSEADVEILAGIIATQPAAEGTVDPPNPRDVQTTFDSLKEMADLLPLLLVTEEILRDEPPETSQIRFFTRSYFARVRGHAYQHHAQDLALEIYRPLDQWMLEHVGFTISDVIELGTAVVDLMQDKFNALMRESLDQGAAAVRLASTKESPQWLKGAVTEFGGKVVRQGLAFAAIEEGLTDSLTFTLEEVTKLISGHAERVTSALQRLSIDMGSVEEGQFRSSFDMNPLVDRPFLHWSDRFILPVPGMLAREYPTLLEEDLLREHKGFAKHRARVLEQLTIKYLSSALPRSSTYSNLYYETSADGEIRRYELDGLILFDRVAFIIEGKATALSLQSQRGDLTRIQRDLGRAVEEAYEQGARARDYMNSPNGATFTDDKGNPLLRIEPGSFDYTFIVNPTLHSLADHAPQLGRLRALGLFARGDFPWSVYINDLRVICEMIQAPSELIHFLIWRAALPLGERVIAVDELDLFGSYLFGERMARVFEDEEIIMQVISSSTDFDDYYMGLTGGGPKKRKPELFTIPLVREFLTRMTDEQPAGWLEASFACLDLSLQDLAFVDVTAPRTLEGLPRDEYDIRGYGKCLLIGLGEDLNWQVASEHARSIDPSAERVIFVQRSDSDTKIVWAVRLKDPYSAPSQWRTDDRSPSHGQLNRDQ